MYKTKKKWQGALPPCAPQKQFLWGASSSSTQLKKILMYFAPLLAPPKIDPYNSVG